MPRLLAFAIWALFSGSMAAAAEKHIDPETGLAGWRWQDTTASITFNQRLPVQSRAYFQGRGFTPEAAERIARSCVFQAILRNRAAASRPMRLDLAEWRVFPEQKGPPRPLPLESQWQSEWERRGVSRAARIAFRWSLFPTVQTFEPGDWNMGMITVGLPAGETFDLEVVWRQGEEPRVVRFEGMQCAPDREI